MSSGQVSSGGSSQALGSRKRKDRIGPWARQPHVATKTDPPKPAAPVPPPQLPVNPVLPGPQHRPGKPAGAGGNWLLAGYLAHEYLTKGTLFGKPPDRRRPETPEQSPELRRNRRTAQEKSSPAAYDDMAYLLMTDGAHVAGVVNPSQLAHWLRM